MGYNFQQHSWPTIAAVTTLGLVNWAGQDIDHFISINGWDPTDNKVTYTDTANDSRARPRPSVEGEPSFYINALEGGTMSEKVALW